MNHDLEVASAALVILARYNIPTDVQELLIYGNPDRDVRPGALSAAMKAVLQKYRDIQIIE